MNAVKLLTRALTLRYEPTSDTETADRILDAARHQAELFGIRRMTMEDVARRSGLTRVTIYRHFQNKDDLMEAVIMREARVLLTRLAELLDRFDSDEDRIVEAFVYIVGALRDDALLRQLLHGEPETILPQLTIEAAPLIAFAREMVVAYVKRRNTLGLRERDIAIGAEAAIRLALSLILTPESIVDFDDPEGVRRLVRHYIVPFADAEVIQLLKAKAGPKKQRPDPQIS